MKLKRKKLELTMQRWTRDVSILFFNPSHLIQLISNSRLRPCNEISIFNYDYEIKLN